VWGSFLVICIYVFTFVSMSECTHNCCACDASVDHYLSDREHILRVSDLSLLNSESTSLPSTD
jgi:hypothetical protein